MACAPMMVITDGCGKRRIGDQLLQDLLEEVSIAFESRYRGFLL